jgi:hypothetical protein
MFSRKAISALVAAATFTPFVAAHGHLRWVEVDGKRFDGPIPNSGDGQQFTIREVYSVDPVKGADTRALNCGQGATNAALVADVNPGSTLKFNWANGEEGTWVHDTGVMMTYMASCGDGGCANFDPINAEFFKIDEKGRNPSTGRWSLADLASSQDATDDVTLPSNLPKGEYLVRHELLALHNANNFGGAEFYPSCFQVRMNQADTKTSALPDSSETVKLPGAYSDNDPGIFYQGAYDPSAPYTFPGPNVISAVPSQEPASSTSSVEPTSTSADAPAATTALPPCGGYKKMKRVVRRSPVVHEVVIIKREPHNIVAAVKREARPVVMSRVMRGIN